MTSQKEAKDKPEAANSSAAETKASSNDSQELNSLISALEGDLSAIDNDAALNLIDNWYSSLHKSKDSEVKEAASSLKELKQLLKGGKATGHEIGELLMEIGEQTIHLADTDKELNTPLQKLGKQLTKAGKSLSKAEDQEHIEQIDSLLETLEGDLASSEHEAVLSSIDQWYALLHKSQSENVKEIANGLKELKQILKRSKPKATDIGSVLIKLGEQTTEAATEAGRGLKGPIKKLGKLLTKTGKSFE